MTLTQTERILLISSLQTLKAQLLGLKAQGALPENESANLPTIEGCDFAIEALERGFTVFYSSMTSAVGAPLLEHELPHEECVFTLDVLEMFRRILHYQGENPKDEEAKDPALGFMGFDGNYEGKHAALAKFAVERCEYCPELKGKKFRTRWPMADRYRRMVARWRDSHDRANLTREDVADILKAAKSRESHREVSHAA